MRVHTAVRRLTGAVAKENPVPLLRNRVFLFRLSHHKDVCLRGSVLRTGKHLDL